MIRLMLVPLLKAIRRGVTLPRTKMTCGHKHRCPLTPGQLLGLTRAQSVSSWGGVRVISTICKAVHYPPQGGEGDSFTGLSHHIDGKARE